MTGRELHPELPPGRRRELVLQGVEELAAGRYFAAHEPWEEVWRSTTPEPRDLFQGLVQVAAAFHHLERGKPAVARRVLGKARRRLAGLAVDDACGLDVADLLVQVDRWRAWLARREGDPPTRPAIRVVDLDAVR